MNIWPACMWYYSEQAEDRTGQIQQKQSYKWFDVTMWVRRIKSLFDWQDTSAPLCGALSLTTDLPNLISHGLISLLMHYF